MRLLPITLLLLLNAVCLLAQFRDIGITCAASGQRLTLKTQPVGIVIERQHPTTEHGLHFHIAAAGQLRAPFVAFLSPRHDLPGIQYATMGGASTVAGLASGVPSEFLSYLAVRWWVVEVAALVVVALAWRRRRDGRGFAVEVE